MFCPGCAFVQFTTRGAAEKAADATFNKLTICGSKVTIRSASISYQDSGLTFTFQMGQVPQQERHQWRRAQWQPGPGVWAPGDDAGSAQAASSSGRHRISIKILQMLVNIFRSGITSSDCPRRLSPQRKHSWPCPLCCPPRP